MTQDMRTMQMLAGLLMMQWVHSCSAELVGPVRKYLYNSTAGESFCFQHTVKTLRGFNDQNEEICSLLQSFSRRPCQSACALYITKIHSG